jgi:hypothetical protein
MGRGRWDDTDGNCQGILDGCEGVLEMSDTPRTDAAVVSREYIAREMNIYAHKFILADHMRDVERELAAAIEQRDEKDRQLADCYNRMCNAEAQRDKTMREADAMDEFLGAAAKREKEAAAIINSLTADIKITVPIRDYSEMSPLDCYELGMMDGVAALKEQINAAIDAAMKECE